MTTSQILIIPRSIKEFKSIMKQFGKPYTEKGKNQYLITKKQYQFYQQNKEHRVKVGDGTTGLGNMSDSKFAEYHRNYLHQVNKKKSARGTFQGKYVLICFDENESHDRKRHLMKLANGPKSVKNLLALHEDHNYLLLHQSRARKYGIKRSNPVWRDLS